MKTALFAGLLLAAGVASANEPVALSDAQMDGVTAGFYYNKVVNVYENVYRVRTNINTSLTLLKGNTADAEAQATAYGKDTATDTITVTETTNYSSFSGSLSSSATSWTPW